MTLLPRLSRRPLLFFFSLLFFLSILSIVKGQWSIVVAGATFWNRTSDFYSQGSLDEFNNWGFRDSPVSCSRTQGRSFTFSHNYSFPLSGLSLLVLVPGLQESRFDPTIFRLSLFKQLPTHNQQLTTAIPAASAKMIQREGNLDPTFDLYFPLPALSRVEGSNVNGQLFFDGSATYQAVLECLTDETGFYRVWESGDLPTGLTTYYNSTTASPEPYYMEGRKILFSLWRPKDSSVYPALASNLSIVSSQLSIAPPKFHPIILIHGLGGRPENWSDEARGTNYVKLLTDLGYPPAYIRLYSFGYKSGFYNYQGDIKEIANNLESVVSQLSKLHQSQGGDGKVDLLGYSLGTLVGRYYLNSHPTSHNVRKFIAVGAPFKGSWVMDLDQKVKDVPGVGKGAESGIAKTLIYYIRKVGLTDANLTPSSNAAQQLRSDSQFMMQLNDPSNAPQNVKVYSLYSDINLTIEQKIFGKVLRKKVSVGDGVILPESATSLPRTSPELIAFSDTAVSTARLSKNADASFSLELPKLASLSLFHNNMLLDGNIRSKIINIATAD